MSDEKHYLGIRLAMEKLISTREAMKALNEWRAMRGESQAYGDEAFFNNAESFGALAEQLKEGA